ncbi:hypothetical protein MGN70_002632 [Eutypa lata]|nr:hypothetical protein MGN70_002632 [Eutypa lata]
MNMNSPDDAAGSGSISAMGAQRLEQLAKKSVRGHHPTATVDRARGAAHLANGGRAHAPHQQQARRALSPGLASVHNSPIHRAELPPKPVPDIVHYHRHLSQQLVL